MYRGEKTHNLLRVYHRVLELKTKAYFSFLVKKKKWIWLGKDDNDAFNNITCICWTANFKGSVNLKHNCLRRKKPLIKIRFHISLCIPLCKWLLWVHKKKNVLWKLNVLIYSNVNCILKSLDFFFLMYILDINLFS